MSESLRLLILDNSADEVVWLRHLLSTSGVAAQAHHGLSWAQGLNCLAEKVFDVLLFSASFGLERLAPITEQHPLLAIVLLTESQYPAINGSCKTLGVQEWLSKSDLNPRLLGRSLQRAINQKLTEASLDAAKNQIDNLNHPAKDAFFTFNSEGKILSVNGAGELLLCSERCDLIGSPVADIFDGVTARQFGNVMQWVEEEKASDFSAFTKGRILNDKHELIEVEYSVSHWYQQKTNIFCLLVRDIALFQAIEKQVKNAFLVQKVIAHCQLLREQNILLIDKLHEVLHALLTLPWVRNDPSAGLCWFIEQEDEAPITVGLQLDICAEERLAIAQYTPLVFNDLDYIHDLHSNRFWFALKLAGGKRMGFLVFSKRPPLLANSESATQFRLLLSTVAMMIGDDRTSKRIARFSKAIEQSPVGVVMTDSTGKIRYANQAVVNMTGYSQADVLGNNPRILKSGLESESTYSELWATIQAGNIWKGEIRNRRKDGVVYWESMLIAPVEGLRKGEFDFIAIKENIDQRKSDEKRLLHMATHDPLTGLPNRTLLLDRLKQALARSRRDQQGVTLLLLDLDQFSYINDQQGHLMGDELLKILGGRLQSARRDSDTVGRQGGDEFVVVLPQVCSEERVQPIVDAILSKISEPCLMGDFNAQMSCSIGVAICSTGETAAEDLYRQADIAMYQAKRSGGNTSRIFCKEMDEFLHSKIWYRSAIRQALDNQEFQVYYQPQIDTRTGNLIGAEALLRWFHPVKGQISPADFIPIAEETGDIVDIGDWVIRAVCQQLHRWLEQGINPPRIAINLSAQQLADCSLPAKIAAYLNEFQIAHELLEVELTESEIMHSPERSISVLTDFRKMGVHVSGDDFGTGYSSLSYLKRLPLDRLKIDCSFIADITRDQDSHAIASMIIDLGHNLGLKVLAEGVEQREQLTLLTRMGCDEFQGFYCSPAVSAADFIELTRDGRQLVDVEKADKDARVLLLLDDEAHILKSLRRLFRSEGYRVLTCEEPGQAFDCLAEYDVGVVLCDQHMPTISGTEFLTRVKGMYPNSVRMILSGYTELSSIIDAVNQGSIYKFLTKPCDSDLLKQHVEEAFQLYEAKRDQRSVR